MRDLERELRALSSDVAWPETPDLAAAVRPRLVRRRRPRRRGRIAAALIVLLLGGVAAVEPARSAVLELLGLRSVRIERREPTATPSPPGADLGLGLQVTQAEVARRAAGFRPRPPTALGAPDAVFLSDLGHVTYAYGRKPDVIVTELRATVTPFIEKSLGAGARLERLRVDGDPAYFISGAPHGIAYVEPGSDVRFDEQRLAGNTLLVERADLLIRVEGDLDRDRAAEIARSIPR